MIKDRVIQKRIKGKVVAVAMTAFMASLFVPLGVRAADGNDNIVDIDFDPTMQVYVLGDGTYPLKDGTIQNENGSCPGHKVRANKGSIIQSIKVERGGDHKIILENGVKITPSEAFAAIELEEGATATVIVEEGNCELSGGANRPAIAVPKGATLNIEVDAGKKLTANATGTAAGIGGFASGDSMTAGMINIKGKGTIEAKGGHGGAGIGGYRTGGIQDITIKDTTVKAIGGDKVDGETAASPGIGVGYVESYVPREGKITVNGGNVIAIGGKTTNSDDSRTDGIMAHELTSDSSSNGSLVINTTGGLRDGIQKPNLNGLVWSITYNGSDWNTGKLCTVYGTAILDPNTFKLEDPAELLIPKRATLIIPSSWTTTGRIYGEGTLIGSDVLTDVNNKLEIPMENRLSMLSVDYIKANDNLVYTGNAFNGAGDAWEILPDKYDKDPYTGYWKPVITTQGGTVDNPVNELKDAGKYQVIYQSTKEGISDIPAVDIEIKQRPLTDGCTVSNIESLEYTGQKYDADAIKVELLYENKQTGVTIPLTKNTDFYNAFSGNQDTTNAKKGIPFKICGYGNFTGEIDATFDIERASFNATEKMEVSIDNQNAPSEDSANSGVTFPRERYDGKQKTTAITVKRKGLDATAYTDGVIPAANYTVTRFRMGEGSEERKKTDDNISAGIIYVEITGTGNFEGTFKTTYEIERKPLEVASITAEKEGNIYDGTCNVKITALKMADGYEKDLVTREDRKEKDSVGVDCTKFSIIGQTPSADVVASGYDTVYLRGVSLGEPDGSNYTIDGDYVIGQASKALTDYVKFGKGVAPVLKIPDAEYDYVANADHTAFIYTVKPESTEGVKFENIDKQYVRYYMGDSAPEGDEGWTDSPEFIVEPGSEHMFWVKVLESDNLSPSESPNSAEKKKLFSKLPQDGKPEAPTLVIPSQPTDAEDESWYNEEFAVEIIPAEADSNKNLEYSFVEDGEYTVDGNIGMLPSGEPCIGYVRYAGDLVYEASEPAASESSSVPAGHVRTPVIHIQGTDIEKDAFSGMANIQIDCDTSNAEIYYTIDGADPKNSELKYTEPFPITDKTTVRAIAKKQGMENSKEAEAKTFENKGRREPGGKTEVLADKHLSEYLAKTYETAEGTKIAMLNLLLDETKNNYKTQGYLSTNAVAYDLNVWMEIFDEEDKSEGTQPPTQEDFNAGVSVTIPYSQLKVLDGLPDSVSGSTHDFVGLHMYSDGNYEEIPVVEAENKSGLTITVHGASPIVIAWKVKSNPEDPNDPTNPEDPNNPTNPEDPNNPTNPEDPNDPTNPEDPNNPINPDDPNNSTNPDDPNNSNDPNSQDPDVTGNQNGDGTGTNGTSTSTDAATQGAAGALSSIMPRTGDPISFIPWIAAAVVSIGVIVGLVKKKNGKKKSPKKNTKNTTKKTTQSTKKKK